MKHPKYINHTPRKAALVTAGYWFFTLVYLELMLHLEAFGAPKNTFFFVAGFSFVFACALTLLTSFLPKKWNFAVSVGITVLLIILYGSQMVYNFVFGTLYSASQMGMGADAVTSFWRETLMAMKDNFHWLLPLFVPLVAAILLYRFCAYAFSPTRASWRIVILIAAAVIQLASIFGISSGGTGYFTNYYFYYGDSTTQDQAATRFGLLTAFRLDIFGSKEPPSAPAPETTAPPETEAAAPTDTQDGFTEAVETEPPAEPEYNVISIDFDMLNSLTADETLLAINDYVSGLSGTTKNEYTGMLKDYNLIVLCGESFSTAAIDPEITPTLYKLANEGFVFTNYYNSFPNNTINGEYALCMGLFPDQTRDKASNSFLASRNCYLPYCLGNAFQEQLGVQGYGYHNNNRDYYSRGASHKNMGYIMKFSGSGMTFTSKAWPKSDLEMMEQSVDDYITQDQFVAYYMTFSGHMRYDVSVNGMAEKNYEAVAHLNYSEPAKCYLACHVELDNALKYLLERLEEAGIADRTAIVLAGDHYPYGLTDKEYSELIGYEIDDFSKYKSSLIFWVGGMEESIVVDEYCCNVDILPTILNLWGFEYDSRMLAGTDILSDSEHVAIRIDKSFYTDKLWLDANTGEIRYLVDESEIPEGYIENMMRSIETKFSVSSDILNKSYYRFVFEKGSEAVTRLGETEEAVPTE